MSGKLGAMAKKSGVNTSELGDAVRRWDITHVTVPPSVLAVEDDLPATLRTVVVAGEACPPALVDRWSGSRRSGSGSSPRSPSNPG